MYREELQRNPENGWSLFGLAQSLKVQGKETAAIDDRFKVAWKNADIELKSSRL